MNVDPNEFQEILARTRLLALAIIGAPGSGMSIDEGEYHEALAQGACDLVRQLEQLETTSERACGTKNLRQV